MVDVYASLLSLLRDFAVWQIKMPAGAVEVINAVVREAGVSDRNAWTEDQFDVWFHNEAITAILRDASSTGSSVVPSPEFSQQDSPRLHLSAFSLSSWFFHTLLFSI